VDQASGKTADRPQFKALMARASRHEFDLVLFWSLDRFSREGVLETLQHLQTLTPYGVAWKSFTEQYLDSCGCCPTAGKETPPLLCLPHSSPASQSLRHRQCIDSPYHAAKQPPR
jgi:hypothetical protein